MIKLSLLLCLPTLALGEIAGGGVIGYGSLIPPGAEAAFEEGLRAEQPLSPAEPRLDLTGARRLLKQGEAAYMRAQLRKAEGFLVRAVQSALREPKQLKESQEVVDTILLLAQVQLSRHRKSAADKTLLLGLRNLPAFPKGGQPAPSVEQRLRRLKRRKDLKLSAQLSIESQPEGLPLWINGVRFGRTPQSLSELPHSSLGVAVEGPYGRVWREISLETGSATLSFDLDLRRYKAQAQEAIQRGDQAGTFFALAALESATNREESCWALVKDQQVMVLRISGQRRQLLGARSQRSPRDLQAWHILGKLCSAPGLLSQEQMRAWLWPPASKPFQESDRSSSGFGRAGFGWSALALGAVAGGAGGYFAWQAFSAAEEYNQGGAPADESRARSQAQQGDIALVISATLLGAGFYLLFGGE